MCEWEGGLPEGEGAEESQGLMSQSESSDEEPDF